MSVKPVFFQNNKIISELMVLHLEKSRKYSHAEEQLFCGSWKRPNQSQISSDLSVSTVFCP